LSTHLKRTRLWLTSPHFYPHYGGAQNRYRGYIEGFLQRGLDVRVMTGTPRIEERFESNTKIDWYKSVPGTWLPQTVLDGASVERIRLPDSKNSTRTDIYYNALLEVCQRPANGPVVAQLLTNMRPEALPFLHKLKNRGVATVYSVSQFPKWPQKPLKRIFRRRGYQQVYNEFDALVTNSEAIEEFLRDIGVTTRIEYIPNGVNLQRFNPAQSAQEPNTRQALRDRFGILADHRVIVAVGLLRPRKRPDLIIQAWRQVLSRFPDTHLLFVGPQAGSKDPSLGKYSTEIAELITASGAADRVHFSGMVDDVENYLRAADIFILASKREGTPNSVLEAMAVGLPCLVTPFLGISGAIGQAGEHYQMVEPSPESIAGALTELLRSPELAAARGRAGQSFVNENLDQRHSLDRYVELYEELAAVAAKRH
jgi:glycosyltransferase involved in cell wall biosynthesis